MGKTKQAKAKKFDRNVEISAPILDPELIKAIHSPSKGQRLDIRQCGFKALLSDLNSQDSTEEVTPIVSQHMPSYIGISCAVSGYSGYKAYSRKSDEITTNPIEAKNYLKPSANRSRTNSPMPNRTEPQVNHITIDRSHITTADEERRELTEKLTASAHERRRSPSPLPPVEDGRHHGAYVGARYCPLPDPSKEVHTHIPLLGIDDEDPNGEPQDTNKVEQKIASLYGENFVEDWRESMSHKAKKELAEEHKEETTPKNLKDLVTLKPTPPKAETIDDNSVDSVVPVPDVKVLAGVEKQFLTRLLTDENPPMPKTPSPLPTVKQETMSEPLEVAPSPEPEGVAHSPEPVASATTPRPDSPDPSQSHSPELISPITDHEETRAPDYQPSQTLIDQQQDLRLDIENLSVEPSLEAIESKQRTEEKEVTNNLDNEDQKLISLSPIASPDLMGQETDEREPVATPVSETIPAGEEHIEYEIRSGSPVNNEASPSRSFVKPNPILEEDEEEETLAAGTKSATPSPQLETQSDDGGTDLLGLSDIVQINNDIPPETEAGIDSEFMREKPGDEGTTEVCIDDQGGHHYLDLLGQKESFIWEQIEKAEATLAEKGSDLDEELAGKFHAAIGKAKLLINKKCNQFRELCERSINEGTGGQYAVLNDDLAGFWDMLNIQISDVQKSFECIS